MATCWRLRRHPTVRLTGNPSHPNILTPTPTISEHPAHAPAPHPFGGKRAGLAHRGFKADNVLIDDEGRVQVTDFGGRASSWRAAREPQRHRARRRGQAP